MGMADRKKEEVKVLVEIFDEEYTIKGKEESAYIKHIAHKVDQTMRDLHQRIPSLGVNKLAILTAINLAYELSKLQEDYDQLVNILEDRKSQELSG